jgi:hypothetical protein
MASTPREYFDLLIAMRNDPRGAEALNSLDIIDTKAGGIAGLIGGFSAAAFFIVQLSIERHVTSPLFYTLSFLAIALLSTSGLLCAASLYIINHFQAFLFSGLEERSEQEKIDLAADRILIIYQKRVERYLGCLYLLFAGIACLAMSVTVYLIFPN